MSISDAQLCQSIDVNLRHNGVRSVAVGAAILPPRIREGYYRAKSAASTEKPSSMTLEDFNSGKSDDLHGALRALWLDAHGDWEQAHIIAGAIDGPEGASVHAYLHRKEGDTANAGYWYRRAGHPRATSDLQAEWESLVRETLARENLTGKMPG